MICGGRISGNSASGRPDIAINPPITVSTAITIATIGRLIKKLEIIVYLILCNLWMVDVRLRLNDHSRSDFYRAFGNNDVTCRETFLYHPQRSSAFADFHRTKRDLVVCSNNSDLIRTLQLRDCSLRHHQRILLETSNRAHFAILSGSQRVVWIRKNPGDANRACLRIYLSICEIEFAFVGISRAIGKNQFELQVVQTSALLGFAEKWLRVAQVILLAEREIDLDRIECRNSCKRIARRAH